MEKAEIKERLKKHTSVITSCVKCGADVITDDSEMFPMCKGCKYDFLMMK